MRLVRRHKSSCVSLSLRVYFRCCFEARLPASDMIMKTHENFARLGDLGLAMSWLRLQKCRQIPPAQRHGALFQHVPVAVSVRGLRPAMVPVAIQAITIAAAGGACTRAAIQ